jgi:hypothetical protein
MLISLAISNDSRLATKIEVSPKILFHRAPQAGWRLWKVRTRTTQSGRDARGRQRRDCYRTGSDLWMVWRWHAALYTRAADRKRASIRAMKMMERRQPVDSMCPLTDKVGTPERKHD